MSEYWVSKKKYFCKYCEIYIADDVPSRQQHEKGLRHQGNRERFIKNIYKSSEKKKKDSEEEKRELARVEQAARAAFAQDISAGNARPIATASSSTSGSTTKTPKPARPSNPFTNYTTPESLGYTDPDAERVAVEAELRRTQGVVGDWQVVTPSPRPHQPIEPPDQEESRVPVCHSDDDLDGYSKLRKRTIATGLGEIYDPGIISVKKLKREPSTAEQKPEADLSLSAAKQDDEHDKPTGSSKWVKVQWQNPEGLLDVDAVTSEFNPCQDLQFSDDAVKTEIEQPPSASVTESRIKTEDDTAVSAGGSELHKTEETSEIATPKAGTSLFKKRKTPAGAGNRR